MNLYHIIFFALNLILACLALSLSFLFYFFRGGSIYRAASSLMLVYGFWLIVEFLEFSSRITELQIFFSNMQFFILPVFSIIWVSYCFNISFNHSFFKAKSHRLLFLYPAVIFMLVFTNNRHRLIWNDAKALSGGFGITHDATLLSTIVFVILIASILAGVILLSKRPKDEFLYSRLRLAFTAGAALIAVAVSLIEWFTPTVSPLKLMPASIFVMGFISISIIRENVRLQIMLSKYDVLDTLKEPLFIVRADGLILFANQAAITMTDAADIEFPGSNIKYLIPSLGDLTEGVIFHEDLFYTINANAIMVSREDLLIISLTEITELKDSEISLKHLRDELEKQIENRTEKLNESNVQLEKLLEEKNILLQEVHHRVNNNLQLIISLLNLQGSRTDNDELKNYLKEAVARVQTIAMVHLMLYRSEDFTRINLRIYLEDLVKSILKENAEHLTMDFTDLICSTTTCIQIGMIMNEIILNALKYAYSIDEKEKRFYCSSRIEKQTESADRLHIEFRDYGKGLNPEEQNENQKSSLGFRIINTLVSQRNGELNIYNDSGCVYKLWVEL